MAGRDFEELDVYKQARLFRNAMYSLAHELPSQEKYGLAVQIRRAAVSVTNNIAEGHGTYTFKHNINYLHLSRGSVYELRDDLNVCEDQSYFSKEQIESLRQEAARVTMLIDGYIRYLRNREPFQAIASAPDETRAKE